MRLTEKQAQIIHETVADEFGVDARVSLFGSRTDDSARGGDIDLLVETGSVVENRASAAARLCAILQRRLGEQRIDVVLVDPQTAHQPIHDIARQTGIEL